MTALAAFEKQADDQPAQDGRHRGQHPEQGAVVESQIGDYQGESHHFDGDGPGFPRNDLALPGHVFFELVFARLNP